MQTHNFLIVNLYADDPQSVLEQVISGLLWRRITLPGRILLHMHALPLWWHFAVGSIKIWQIGFSPKLDQIESFSSAYWHIIIWSDSSVQLLLPQQLMMKLNCSSVAAAESVAATAVVHCNSEKQPAACYWPKLCFSAQSFKERVEHCFAVAVVSQPTLYM